MPGLDEFKVFQALLHKFKDFQGLEFLFSNSSTFKYIQVLYEPCKVLNDKTEFEVSTISGSERTCTAKNARVASSLLQACYLAVIRYQDTFASLALAR